MEDFQLFGRRWSVRSLVKRGRMVLLALGIGSAVGLLGLLAWSTGNASRYAQQYDLLLLLNGILAVTLMVWGLVLAIKLARQILRQQFGARLTARFALSFALIGALPGALIYVLSVQFMSRSIESWFNVRVDAALQAGLNLARAALDLRLADVQRRARDMVVQLGNATDAEIATAIARLREASGAPEVLVFSGNNRIVAFSSAEYGQLLPALPPVHILNQLRVSRSYAAAEVTPVLAQDGETPSASRVAIDAPAHLQLRVILPLAPPEPFTALLGASTDTRWLQVIQPVPEQIALNANLVQQGFNDYQELTLSRQGLRQLYGITLTVALILTVFAAMVVALGLSRRLLRSLLRLAEGTQAVGVGDYRPLPEPPPRDEIGQLTRYFNTMTRQLEDARNMVERNRQQLQRSNLYLESVLSNLSAGVLVFDEAFRVTLTNQGAQAILQVDLRAVTGKPLETVAGALELAQRIRQAFAAHAAVESDKAYWQQQFELTPQTSRDPHPLTLLARGTRLRTEDRTNGYLVVFDDVSDVISANRVVAWGEVARRLTHEIKNPLTPIQLSAERLDMKLANHRQPSRRAEKDGERFSRLRPHAARANASGGSERLDHGSVDAVRLGTRPNAGGPGCAAQPTTAHRTGMRTPAAVDHGRPHAAAPGAAQLAGQCQRRRHAGTDRRASRAVGAHASAASSRRRRPAHGAPGHHGQRPRIRPRHARARLRALYHDQGHGNRPGAGDRAQDRRRARRAHRRGQPA